MKTEWEKQDAGWWTSILGGIVKDGRKFECYPATMPDAVPQNVSKSLSAAKNWFESNQQK